MISAKEAKQVMKAYLEGQHKIMEVLEDIDTEIRNACNAGKGRIYIAASDLARLTETQLNEVISELKDYGYIINPCYQRYDSIQVESLVKYEIIWDYEDFS